MISVRLVLVVWMVFTLSDTTTMAVYTLIPRYLAFASRSRDSILSVIYFHTFLSTTFSISLEHLEFGGSTLKNMKRQAYTPQDVKCKVWVMG